MHTYKNVTDTDLMVPNVGIIKAGAEVTTRQLIENPSFQYVGEADAAPKVVAITKDQPNSVTDAAPVTNETDNKETK